jgi:hypothetical protein
LHGSTQAGPAIQQKLDLASSNYLPFIAKSLPTPTQTPSPTATPTTGPGAGPLPGSWHGSGDDFTFDFAVTNDSSEVTDKSGTYYCGIIRVDFWIYPPSSIKDGEFSTGMGGPSSGITIHGKFDTSTHVTGTWSGWAYPYSGCGGNWTGTHE